MMKPYDHVCANCYWYVKEKQLCVNCDSPSDIRELMPCHVCDGGGVGADGYGFKPNEEKKGRN